ncbi:extracellular solute-binding protein [Micromonospora sp. DR5-3]|uniref:ABC transporter substrate-binding protein n=1 Tax=unclassified Micromonospora TaxID=2617518 RepID=UPI0011D454A2|nr:MULTISPECIES: extracellular solute-binding protein [unclassified Micromonospora]MCW3820032.1 extracellular solute-binding protein [Micromonospora sp. DR5-3]TYC19567.1 extracellular solute-binding protein [Micromonospora sp. MP36]
MRSRTRTAVAAAGMALALLASGCGADDGDGGAGSKKVEVFTWWADGGEKAGLDGLVAQFKTDCAQYEFVNGAVAGGAGSNAKQVLASRLQQSDPPDTFQAHAGAELSDYIKAGQIEDLSAQYKEWGLDSAFPKGLVDSLTVDGKIYSVPANIHRANVLWGNKSVLSKAGITAPATTLPEFFTQLDTLKAKGVATPLALGKDWTQQMLFEAVLISKLGPEKFSGLWTGQTDWAGADITDAINDYKKLLSYSNKDRDTFDWTDAEKLVMEGKAAYQLMGDWEAADLDAKGFKDYNYSVFPGNGDAYQWLADSFVLPKNAKNPEGTKCWLKTLGSAAGQKAFNTKKGSIPARTDANATDYPAYQQAAIADWAKGKPVPSCPHGSACSQGWQGAVASAQGKFSSDGDVAALQSALVAAAKQYAGK